MTEDVLHHGPRDEWFGAAIGLSKEQVRRGELGGEGERRERVHDEVDPKHLHGFERRVLDGAGADERDDDRDDVDSELELQELGDAVVDVAAPHHRLDDGREVVVREDDVGGLLGDVGSRNAHRETDVGLLQSGAVVGAVARDRHDLAAHGRFAVDHALDQGVLVRGRRPREYPQFRPDLVEEVLLHLALLIADPPVELLALEYEKVLVRLDDAAFERNRARGIYIVARDHSHGDARLLTFADRVRHLGTHRVLDAHDSQAGQVVHYVLLVLPVRLVLNVHLIDLGFAGHEVAIGDRYCSQPVARHWLYHILHQTVLHLSRELLQLTIATINKGTSEKQQHFINFNSHYFIIHFFNFL